MQHLHLLSKLFKALELNLLAKKREIEFLNRALRFRQYLDGFRFFGCVFRVAEFVTFFGLDNSIFFFAVYVICKMCLTYLYSSLSLSMCLCVRAAITATRQICISR